MYSTLDVLKLDKSNCSSLAHMLNIDSILTTLFVLRLFKFTLFKCVHPQNIVAISVTLYALLLEKSMLSRLIHPSNIDDIEVTFCISNFDMSTCFNNLQLLNKKSKLVMLDVSIFRSSILSMSSPENNAERFLAFSMFSKSIIICVSPTKYVFNALNQYVYHLHLVVLLFYCMNMHLLEALIFQDLYTPQTFLRCTQM